jgi:hypothetical protein
MSVQFVQQRPPEASTTAGVSRCFRPSARGSLDPGGRTPDAPLADARTLVRCANPECRLQGYRVWVDVGTDYVCECGTKMARSA